MMPPKKLMSMGFSFICAHCEKLRKGVMRGETHCGYALRGRDCGGPLSSQSFPHYEGALTRSKIADICFRCGEDATKLIGTKDGGFVGACEKHMTMLKPGVMTPVRPKRAKTA